MPKQRRLDSEAKQEAEKLLALRANKKLVQNHLMSLTSKTVTLKDIHNIAGKAVPAFRNDFQELVKEMKKVKGEYQVQARRGALSRKPTYPHSLSLIPVNLVLLLLFRFSCHCLH